MGQLYRRLHASTCSIIPAFQLFPLLLLHTLWTTTIANAAASESRQVLGLVGSSVSLPCLFVTDSESLEADRTSLVASDRARSVTSNRLSTRPRLDLNHTFDSVRLVLFYKESIKSGPIYSIDSRFATQFTAARHFASPTFKSRLSVEGHPTSLLHMPDPSSDGIKATSDSSSPEPGIRLHIRSLGPADAGDYKCRVDFRRGRTLTTHVHLKVIVPPTDVYIADLTGRRLSASVPHSLDQHTDHRLLCLALSASPVPYFHWRMDGRPIDGSHTAPLSIPWTQQDQLFWHAVDDSIHSDLQPETKSSSLSSTVTPSTSSSVVLANAIRELAKVSGYNVSQSSLPNPWSGNVVLLVNISSTYSNTKLTCSAEHPLYPHSVNTSIRISVNVRPVGVHLERTKTAILSGKSETFRCTSWGSRPAATITWLLNDQLLESAKETQSSDGNLTTSRLSITLQSFLDGAKLTCRTHNPKLQQRFYLQDTIQLNVLYKPTVNLSLQSEHVIEGGDLKLHCVSEAKPPATHFEWLLNGQPLLSSSSSLSSSSHNYHIAIDNASSTLYIHNISNQNGGRYQCLARNLIGEQSSDFLTVNVQYRPRCRSNQKLVYGIEAQQQIRVLCDVDSNPLPVRFFWSFTPTAGAAVVGQPRFTSLTTTARIANRTGSSVEHAHGTLRSNTLSTNWVKMKRTPSTDVVVDREDDDGDSRPVSIDLSETYHQGDIFVTTASTPITGAAIVLTHFTSSGHRSSLLYTPNTLHDFGQLSCEAENPVGRQSTACRFSIIPAGRPELVTACRLPKVGQTEILLRCDASYNGGLSQTFHLEVFEKVPSDSMVRLMTPPINTVDGESFKSSTPPSITTSTTTTITPIAHLAASAHLPEYSTFENDASPMYTTSLTSVRLRLVHNLTNSIEPTFSIRHLKHSQPYVFRLYASNLKGRSRKTLQVTVRTLASSYNQSLDTFRSDVSTSSSSLAVNWSTMNHIYVLSIVCIAFTLIGLMLRLQKRQRRLSKRDESTILTNKNSNHWSDHGNSYSLESSKIFDLYDGGKKKQLTDSTTDDQVKVMATFVNRPSDSNDEILTHLHLPAVQFLIPKTVHDDANDFTQLNFDRAMLFQDSNILKVTNSEVTSCLDPNFVHNNNPFVGNDDFILAVAPSHCDHQQAINLTNDNLIGQSFPIKSSANNKSTTSTDENVTQETYFATNV